MTLNEIAKTSGFYDDRKLTLKRLSEMLDLDDFEFADKTKIIVCDKHSVIRDVWLDNMNVEHLIDVHGERQIRRYSIDIDDGWIEVYVVVE